MNLIKLNLNEATNGYIALTTSNESDIVGYCKNSNMIFAENDIPDDIIMICINKKKLTIISGRILSYNCYLYIEGDYILLSTKLSEIFLYLKSREHSFKINYFVLQEYINNGDEYNLKHNNFFFDDIKKISSGSTLTIKNKQIKENVYWKENTIEKNTIILDKQELSYKLNNILEIEVKKKIRDKAILLLSEGIDSTLIGTIAQKFYGLSVICSDFENILDNKKTKMFSQTYGLESRYIKVSNIFFSIDKNILNDFFIPCDSLFLSEIQSNYKDNSDKVCRIFFGGYGADEVFNPEGILNTNVEEILFNYRCHSILGNENEFIFNRMNALKVDPFRSSRVIEFVQKNKSAIINQFGNGKNLLRHLLKELTTKEIYDSRYSDAKEYVHNLEIICINRELQSLKKYIKENYTNYSYKIKEIKDYEKFERLITEGKNINDYEDAITTLRYLLCKIWILNLFRLEVNLHDYTSIN